MWVNSNKRWQRWNHGSDWFLDPLQGSTGKIMRIKKAPGETNVPRCVSHSHPWNTPVKHWLSIMHKTRPEWHNEHEQSPFSIQSTHRNSLYLYPVAFHYQPFVTFATRTNNTSVWLTLKRPSNPCVCLYKQAPAVFYQKFTETRSFYVVFILECKSLAFN